MRWLRRLLLGSAVCFAWAVATLWWARAHDGPWGMLPGGPFRAVGEPCLAGSWQDFATVEELAVEVDPSHPRSVTTWSVVVNGDLFVPADFLTPFKQWPQRVMRDDRIRVRLAGRTFRCRGVRVRDPATIATLRSAAASKYDLDPNGLAARSEVWWFRLAPR